MNGKQSFIISVAIVALFISYAMVRYARHVHVSPEELDTLVVGTNTEYQPFSFIENNTIVGFDIDLIKEIANRLGKKIDIKDMNFEALMPQIQLGKLHIIAAGMTQTPERAQHVLFTKPYLTSDPLLVLTLKEHPAVTSLADLNGKEVLVNEGFTADLYMSKIPTIQLRRLKNKTDALLALKNNRAAAFVTAKSSIDPYFKRQGSDQFNIYTIPNTADSYSLVISKEYPALLEIIECVLESMKQDGSLESLKRKWNLA